MEKETFMDTAVARIMNENFVCIKVDREERPDIDNLYMYACKLISGGGGWPLNAFALPDGKPFFAGTYYTKGGWMNLLSEISKAYKEKGMAGFSQLQQREFALQEHGFKAVKHQSFVGTGYFDYVQNAVQQGEASTVAMNR